jgi:hypothetical protein
MLQEPVITLLRLIELQVLLSRDEFETLSLLLSDYESSDISVDLFAAGLMNLIADAEKVTPFRCCEKNAINSKTA